MPVRRPRWARSSTRCRRATKMQTPAILKRWLDSLDATGRWALLKLLTGALRVGVSARLAKQAVANIGNQPVDAVEEIWHGLSPPYRPLFDWLLHDAPRPSSNAGGAFLPPMLANPIERAELDALDPTHFRAEWKWDGIRVQVAASGGVKRLYSRAGEDVSARLPRHHRGDRLRGRVRRRAAGPPRGDRGAVQRPAAAAQPQGRDAQDAEGPSRACPALRRAVARGRGPARADASTSAAPGWRPGTPRSPRPRFDVSPLVVFTDWAHLAQLREQMTQRRHRGADAEAWRFAPISPAGPRARGSSGSAIPCWSTAC